MTNTLTYYTGKFITAVKGLVVLALGVNHMKLFCNSLLVMGQIMLKHPGQNVIKLFFVPS
jgi:hypothetical protein